MWHNRCGLKGTGSCKDKDNSTAVNVNKPYNLKGETCYTDANITWAIVKASWNIIFGLSSWELLLTLLLYFFIRYGIYLFNNIIIIKTTVTVWNALSLRILSNNYTNHCYNIIVRR